MRLRFIAAKPMENKYKQDQEKKDAPIIVVAGATGKLGQRIAWHLLQRGASVRALVRRGTASPELALLQQTGAEIAAVDYHDPAELRAACAGAVCTVSALSGLADVIVTLQKKLLDATVAAGIPRFLPSDYCIDYTKLPAGSNRNLDLRREFAILLDAAPVQATSILNGMFTDLLTGQAPVILFGLKRIVYWGNEHQPLDFTTMEDTAAFTAAAAMDPATPRYLRIAGDVCTANDLKNKAAQATGRQFRLMRVGGLKALGRMIKITRTLLPKKKEVFPPWQGMQYLHNMFSGLAKLHPLDNSRYSGMHWHTVEDVIGEMRRERS